ncbi:hypothetical protein SRHO_G00198530 [Serrasalmus rhombeus]
MQSRGTTNQRECSGEAGPALSFKPLLRRTAAAVTDRDISPLLSRFSIRVAGGAGAYPSSHRAEGGIRPGQVAGTSQ